MNVIEIGDDVQHGTTGWTGSVLDFELGPDGDCYVVKWYATGKEETVSIEDITMAETEVDMPVYRRHVGNGDYCRVLSKVIYEDGVAQLKVRYRRSGEIRIVPTTQLTKVPPTRQRTISLRKGLIRCQGTEDLILRAGIRIIERRQRRTLMPAALLGLKEGDQDYTL